jgi:hypothetical protein
VRLVDQLNGALKSYDSPACVKRANSPPGWASMVAWIAYDEGQITHDEEVAFFEHLVETGVCWQLSGHSGHYQGVAATLIEAGLIKPPEPTEAIKPREQAEARL